MNQPRRSLLPANESLVLYASMFVMGGCGLAYEYTLSKLSSDLLGNSVEQWAIIIGVMMFFMGVGSDVQKHLSDDGLISKFITAEIALGLCGAFSPILILEAYGSLNTHFVLIQYFFIASIGLLIGFEIPLLARINAAYSEEIKFNLGGVLKMDYIGALCGALAWVFLLPKFFSTTEMAFVLGIMTIATAGVALIYFRKHVERPRGLTALLLGSLFLTGGGLVVAERWTSHAEQALYRDKIVHLESSPYQHVVLTNSPTAGTAMFINGHLQFHSQDEHIYHENLVHPAMLLAQEPRNVLILGGGDGLAAREVLRHSTVEKVTLCDLDPMIVRLAREHPELRRINKDSLRDARLLHVENRALIPGSETDLWIRNRNALTPREMKNVGKVQVVNLDAFKFLEQIDGTYDVVILDFPDPNAPGLAKLYSRTFYEMLRKRLVPGGLIVQQSTSPYYAKEAYLNIGRTLESAGFTVLPYHDTVPSMGDWGFWIGGDAEHHSEISLRSEVAGVSMGSIRTRYLSEETIKASFVFGSGQLVSVHQDVNTITRPVVYEYYVQGWQKYF